MNTALRITAFTAALAASFGVAYGVGGAVPSVVAGPAPAAHAGHDRDTPAGGGGGHREGGRANAPAGGLQISEGGYTLDLRTPRVPAGRSAELRFAIRDDEGREVTAYRREHGKELHLILVSRDLATYRHLHPARADDGTWSVPVKLPEAGDYRLLADFVPDSGGGADLTLGADLAVSGAYRPDELPEDSRTATVDGYTVTLDGALRPGAAGRLDLEVTKDGRPVTDLQPYLGAYGHLVALRSGDLAYLHVHPAGEPDDGAARPGPTVSFTATAPSSGSYRLFLDFKHDGEVRTAAFTVVTAAADHDGRQAEDTGQEEAGQGEGDGHRH